MRDAPDFAVRYANAEKFLRPHVRSLIDSPQVKPNWIRDTDLFWYDNVSNDRSNYVLVDAAARTKGPAFDHERLAEALKGIVEGEVDPGALEVTALEPIDGGLRLTAKGQRVEVSLDTYTVKALGAVNPTENLSPDGRWALFVQDHNLFVREVATDEVRQLTTDGEKSYGYGELPGFAVAQTQQKLGITLPPIVLWSEDSSRLVTYRLDQRPVGLMHIVRSSPPGGGRPQLLSYPYACAGDPTENLPTVEHLLIDIVTGGITEAKCAPDVVAFVPPMAYGRVWWSKDATKYYVLLVDRSDANVWLNEVDAATGDVRRVIEETRPTQFLLAPEYAQHNARTLSTGELLWWAQEEEWGHLYLHGTDGSVRALTSGEWLVRRVVSIDEDARRVVFTAAGRIPDSDPYLMELCSVSLDGGEITAITSDGLDHDPAAAAHGRYFVDNTSRYDVPNVAVLRDSSGDVVMELEHADATKLYAAGWSAPERVVVKAADGVTDIYCDVFTPHDFDPSKKYAVLDEVYQGPQSSACPLRFPGSGGVMVATSEQPIFNAIGFVVVAIDGRGSPLRSKSFQDAARLDAGSLFVDDHATAIQQLAAERPWMDLGRVGIMGHSAGGWASTRAILLRPDAFSVAVSSCGNHDNRINHNGWAEKFYGTAEDFDFEAQANSSLADRLEGKLYLIHGEMDDNAVAHGTMRLVDALVAANKDFDFLMVPNAVHQGCVVNGYWVRKRWDYLVQHLMGEAPPVGYRVKDVPVPALI
ncbi:MAG TPA: DPP IV N-terminal domain-containing protein [Mycobacteriales bacterium]|nr:DPP IV N-terminal domain-containing protein [Mycobacteriales bacterium]